MRSRDDMNINIWLMPIAVFLLAISIIIFGSSYLSTPNQFFMARLDEGWAVSCGNYHAEDVSLSNTNFGVRKRGDKIIISREIPDQKVPAACIMFKSLLSTVEASIDGEKIYEYGHSYEEKGDLVPKNYNYIPIRDDQLGKTIEIVFNVTENNAFTGISTPYYGNRLEVTRSYLQSKRLDLFIGIFLCMFAFMLLTLSSYLYMYHGKDLSLIFSSVISFVLGAYCLCYNNLPCFISDNDYYFTVLEYFSLYLMPLAIIIFLLATHPELKSRTFKVFSIVNVAFPIVALGFHVTHLIHINEFVTPLHIIAVIEGVITLPALFINIYRHYSYLKSLPEYTGMTSDVVLIIGLAIFIACCIIDIVKYNLLRILGNGGEAYAHIGFMTVGALCFVICLFVFYFYHGIEHINAAYVKEHLEGLAYTDALTGLMNRAKCMQYMSSVQGRFAIISLDLDNLKPVNDSMGHIEGDRMIREFADIMKLSFVGAQLIGRTGGDEFIVAIENPDRGICESMIENMEKRMAEYNKNNLNLNLSASSGYAYSDEVPSRSAGDVFNLADSRMYQMKELHHQNKLNRFMADILADEILSEGRNESNA